jgi:3D (Asp-Asp-Asp) domain-containing protein
MKTVLAILLSTMLVSVAPFEYHTEATEKPADKNVETQDFESLQNLEPTQTTEPESTVKKVHYVTTTAYSSTPDQTDDTPFITANGTRVRDGIIATNFLPFGAKVRFPDYSGNKVYTVTDRMNKRFSDRADIWFETREQAMNFGIRKLKMEVL